MLCDESNKREYGAATPGRMPKIDEDDNHGADVRNVLFLDGHVVTFKDADAANAMKVSAQDLLGLKVIDRIIPEPLGGAHRDPAATVAAVGDAIAEALAAQAGKDGETLKRERREKFLRIGRSLAA